MKLKRDELAIISFVIFFSIIPVSRALFVFGGPELFKSVGIKVYRKIESRKGTIIRNAAGIKLPPQAYASTNGPTAEEIYKKANYVTKIEVWSQTRIPGIKFFFGAGSGSVINCKKYKKCVLTAWHVVSRSTNTASYFAYFKDGSPREKLKLVGWSEEYDFAILKFSTTTAKPKMSATIGKSSTLKTGSRIMAIGSNAFGDYWFSVVGNLYKKPLAPGINLKMSLRNSGLPNKKIMFFSTPLFAGYSGGPLLNKDGELVGISSAVVYLNGIATYIGVPIDEIMQEIDRILDSKEKVPEK